MKFRAHSETTSHTGQLRGRRTVTSGPVGEAGADLWRLLGLAFLCLSLAGLRWTSVVDAGRRKMRSLGYPGQVRLLARHWEQLGRFPSH